jgi:hypothetical protein
MLGIALVDAKTVRAILERTDVQEAVDLVIHLYGNPLRASAQRELAMARVARALENYEGTPPLLSFVSEVARRALGD